LGCGSIQADETVTTLADVNLLLKTPAITPQNMTMPAGACVAANPSCTFAGSVWGVTLDGSAYIAEAVGDPKGTGELDYWAVSSLFGPGVTASCPAPSLAVTSAVAPGIVFNLCNGLN
jgi:hypothetical protein